MLNSASCRYVFFTLCAALSAANYLVAQRPWTAPDYTWEEAQLRVPYGEQHRYFHFMTSDNAGYVWIARDRVDRFDGLRFRTLPDFETGLRLGEDLTITPGPDGLVWLSRHSATGSLGYHAEFETFSQHLIEPHSLQIVPLSDYFADRPPPVDYAEIINVFCQSAGQECYFGLRSGGVLGYAAGKWKLLQIGKEANSDKLQHLAFAHDGKRWFIFPERVEIYGRSDSLIHRYEPPCRQLAIKSDGGVGGALPNNVLELAFHPDVLPGSLTTATSLPYARSNCPEGESDYALPNGKGEVYRINAANRNGYITDNDGRRVVDFPSSQYGKFRLVDRQGRFWLATPEGYTVGAARRRIINSCLDDPANAVSVRSIIAMDADSLWLNTYAGVYKLANPVPQRTNEPVVVRGLPATYLGLSKLADGRLLAGQHSSHYFTIEPRSGRALMRAADYRFVGEMAVHLVYPAANGELWALGNYGVLHQAKGDTFRLVEELPVIKFSYATETNEGLWLTSDRGLYLVNSELATVRDSFPVLRGFEINHFDRNGDTFYLATNRGVVIWNKGDEQYEVLGLQLLGLPKEVHGVYRTQRGQLFYSTNHGIFRYDLTSRQYQKYTTRHGMPSNECNWLAHFRATDGTLYFGTIQGLAYFHPDSIDVDERPGHAAQLRYDKVEMLRPGKGMQDVAMEVTVATPAVTMRPTDALLSLGVALPANPSLTGVRLRYRLLNDASLATWIATEDATIQLNRPAPGEYKLEVEGTYGDGTLIVPPTPLRLTVLAPFYQRSWFWGSLFLLSSAGYLALSYYRKRQYVEREHELTRRVKAATLKINADNEVILAQNEKLTALNQEKQQLLSVIAHDLKGPFTGLRGVGGKVRYLLKLSDHRRLDALSDTIDQVVNTCLSTLNNLLLSNSATDLTSTFQSIDLVETFATQLAEVEPVANHHGVAISFEHPGHPLFTEGIPYAINSLFRNLVENALKFSGAGKTVAVTLSAVTADCVELKVTDRGAGLSEEEIANLLNANARGFTWEPRMNSTGLGWQVIRTVAEHHRASLSIDSNPGRGTTVTVSFLRSAP